MVISGFQGHADVPGVQFADNLVVVGLTGLLDTEPDECQRAGLVSSGPLLGCFRSAWATVVITLPRRQSEVSKVSGEPYPYLRRLGKDRCANVCERVSITEVLLV